MFFKKKQCTLKCKENDKKVRVKMSKQECIFFTGPCPETGNRNLEGLVHKCQYCNRLRGQQDTLIRLLEDLGIGHKSFGSIIEPEDQKVFSEYSRAMLMNAIEALQHIVTCLATNMHEKICFLDRPQDLNQIPGILEDNLFWLKNVSDDYDSRRCSAISEWEILKTLKGIMDLCDENVEPNVFLEELEIIKEKIAEIKS